MLVYILSILIAIGGLVLLIASPVLGVIFVLVGAGLFFIQKRVKKAKVMAATQMEMTKQAEPEIEETAEKARETHKVAGISQYTKEVLSLGNRNPQYDYSVSDIKEEGLEDEEIYQYDFYPMSAKLVPEPDNQYDPNAIAVYIEEKKIGYIKAGSTAHVKKLMDDGRIKSITCNIVGGKYKKYDSEEKQLNNTYLNYGARLTFFLSEE